MVYRNIYGVNHILTLFTTVTQLLCRHTYKHLLMNINLLETGDFDYKVHPHLTVNNEETFFQVY